MNFINHSKSYSPSDYIFYCLLFIGVGLEKLMYSTITIYFLNLGRNCASGANNYPELANNNLVFKKMETKKRLPLPLL